VLQFPALTRAHTRTITLAAGLSLALAAASPVAATSAHAASDAPRH
jgi:hypothetical protein